MAGSLNKVTLIGNLGKDPEIRSFQNGNKVANFSIATSERWTDKASGEKKERTEWHRIAVFNEGLVKVIDQYVKKGSKVYVEGQLETRKWQDKDGRDQYSTEVVLRPFNGTLILLGDGGKGNSSGRRDDPGHTEEDAYGYGSAATPPKGKSANRATGGFRDELSDEIPFAPQVD